MSPNDLPHPLDEGGSRGARKKTQEDDTMITVSLTEAEWCDLFIDLGHGLKSALPHLPRDIRIIKAFAHLRGLCANSVATDSLNSFQERYYRQEASAAAQRSKHSQSRPPEAIDTALEHLRNREVSEEFLGVVRATDGLDRSISSLLAESNTGPKPLIKTNGGKPVANQQIFCHDKSVLFLDEHESDSEETIKSRASVSAMNPATTSSHENSDSLQAENIQMANKIEHGRPESTSPTTSTVAVINLEAPDKSLTSKTPSRSLTLPTNQADSSVNPKSPPTSSPPYTNIANQISSLSPGESPGALRLESFSPILNTIKENHLAEDRCRDSQVYGGALEEYLAPLPRHSLIVGVGDVEGDVTTPSKLSATGWIPEVTLSSPPGQAVVFTSPSSTCTTSARSGIPRSTATFGKDKELPLTPPAPITARKLISKTLKGKETSPSASRAKGAKEEPAQPKLGLMKTHRTPSGGDGNTSNISKLLAKKTYPVLKREVASKEKTADLGRFTSLRDTSATPPPRVIDRSLLAKDVNNRKLPIAKMLENVKPELGAKSKAVAPPVPTDPRSPDIVPATKLSTKSLTPPPVHRGKHAPGYIMDKRGTRTSISSSLLSSPKRRFNSAISIYEDTPLLREDSSSTLLSAASNSSENIATMAWAEPEALTTAGFSKGSPKLVEVSKNVTEFGISLGTDNSQRVIRSPSRIFSGNSISTVLECEEEDALPPSPPNSVNETTNPARGRKPLSSGEEHLDKTIDKSCVPGAENTKNSNPLPGPIVPQDNGEFQSNTNQPLARAIGMPSPSERANTVAFNTDYSSPSHGKVPSKTLQRPTSTGSNKTTKSTSTASTSTSRSSATVKATRPRYSRNDKIVPPKTIPTKPPENPKAAAQNGNVPTTKNFLRHGSSIKMGPPSTFRAATPNNTLAESIDSHLSGRDANGTRVSHENIQNSEAKNKLKPTTEYAHSRSNPPSGEWLGSLGHYKGDTAKSMGNSRAITGQETLASTNSKLGDTIPSKHSEICMPRRNSQSHPTEGPLKRNDENQALPQTPPTENPPRKMLTPTKVQALTDLSSIGSKRNPRTLPSPGRSWFGRRSLVSVPTLAISGKENYDPSNAQQGTTPVKKEKVKSRSLGNLAGWLHRPPKTSPDGLFSRGAKKDKDKLATATSSLIVRSVPATLTLQPPGRHEQRAEFSHNDVENLIKRLSTQLPGTPDGSCGFNALGGKYYTSGYIPNLDESPSKESNPIAVCMDLINSASEEAQSPRRERLLQMSSIMVDAVSKSRDAECAAEEAKIAAAKAEYAFLETRKCLQSMTELLKKRGKDVLCEILF
ncbi:unnamed protein product [Tuber aestivum]|uniref:Uncharacterized protein n=1 Tax=Tuber aestivum TaxID=59557 RepID=A0A292Q807_9PEZI|nr:unnamed protein product [Tuber aestivum]